MASRLDCADSEHAPGYPEASNPDNVPYYTRFGFEHLAQAAKRRPNDVADVAPARVSTADLTPAQLAA